MAYFLVKDNGEPLLFNRSTLEVVKLLLTVINQGGRGKYVSRVFYTCVISIKSVFLKLTQESKMFIK